MSSAALIPIVCWDEERFSRCEFRHALCYRAGSILVSVQDVIELQDIPTKRALVFGLAHISLPGPRNLPSQFVLAVKKAVKFAAVRLQCCAEGKQISAPAIQVFRNQITRIEILIVLAGK